MLGTFNGSSKLFLCNAGVTTLDVTDLYSAWKQWVQSGQGIGFLPMFEAIGGQPLPGGLFAGQSYFLINGWKIKPQSANHRLNIIGNLYSDDGSNITVEVAGFTVEIALNTSAQAQGISVSGSTLTLSQIESSALLAKQAAIAELNALIAEIHLLHGLKPGSPLIVTDTQRTAGEINQAISSTETQTTVSRQ